MEEDHEGHCDPDRNVMFIRTGVLDPSSCAGSAFLSNKDQIKLLCCVYGPHSYNRRKVSEHSDAWTKGDILVNITYSPFSNAALQNTQKYDYQKLVTILSDTFNCNILIEKFPNTQIEIALSIIECQGYQTLVAPCINCISMALANANIPMKTFCVATSVALLSFNSSSQDMNNKDQTNEKYIINPFQKDIDSTSLIGITTIAFCNNNSSIMYIESYSKPDAVNKRQMMHMFHLVENVCSQVYKTLTCQLKNEYNQQKLLFDKSSQQKKEADT